MVSLTSKQRAWVSASAALALSCAAGCGAQGESAGLPTHPPLPTGWTVTETETGDLRLALPPEVQPFSVTDLIIANEPPSEPDATSWFEVQAVPPLSMSQPAPGGSVEDWLQEQASQGTPGASSETRSVALPAGDAVELRMSFFLGEPGETVVVAYAIRTTGGYGYLRMTGSPAILAAHQDDIRLIPLLIEFASRTETLNFDGGAASSP